MEAIWTYEDRHLKLHITANRFLRNMVRSLVGHFVDVGIGRISATEMLQHLDRHVQHMSSQPVPACGLYLTHVAYNMDELRLPATLKDW
jgi:tRNA pseudouridine38-40 synthase